MSLPSVGDSSALELEDVIYDALDGRTANIDGALSRLFLEGQAPVSIVRALMRQAQRLHFCAAQVAGGQPLDLANQCRPDDRPVGNAPQRFDVLGLADPKTERVARLPLSALFSEGGDPSLYIVDDKGEVALKPVSVKSYETNCVVITGGVDDGSKVVVLGVQKIDPAQKVRVVSSLSF